MDASTFLLRLTQTSAFFGVNGKHLKVETKRYYRRNVLWCGIASQKVPIWRDFGKLQPRYWTPFSQQNHHQWQRHRQDYVLQLWRWAWHVACAVYESYFSPKKIFFKTLKNQSRTTLQKTIWGQDESHGKDGSRRTKITWWKSDNAEEPEPALSGIQKLVKKNYHGTVHQILAGNSEWLCLDCWC